jgi:electron transport complex protein RnfE
MNSENKSLSQEFIKGVVLDNPILVLMLGLCPALAVPTSALNGLGMGGAATFVLLCSNVIVALIKGWVPAKVRIPVFIVVIASFVTIVDLFMQAFSPALAKALGIFVPLIVVNCVILGRAEAFASKSGVVASIVDALGMGFGFTAVLFLLGGIREVLGSGTFLAGTPLEVSLFQSNHFLIMILSPGAFITLGLMMGLSNRLMKKT